MIGRDWNLTVCQFSPESEYQSLISTPTGSSPLSNWSFYYWLEPDLVRAWVGTWCVVIVWKPVIRPNRFHRSVQKPHPVWAVNWCETFPWWQPVWSISRPWVEGVMKGEGTVSKIATLIILTRTIPIRPYLNKSRAFQYLIYYAGGFFFLENKIIKTHSLPYLIWAYKKYFFFLLLRFYFENVYPTNFYQINIGIYYYYSFFFLPKQRRPTMDNSGSNLPLFIYLWEVRYLIVGRGIRYLMVGRGTI